MTLNPKVENWNKTIFEDYGIKTPQDYIDEDNWTLDTFRKMLNYERQNDREKFIYEINQMLNAYYNIEQNFEF